MKEKKEKKKKKEQDRATHGSRPKCSQLLYVRQTFPLSEKSHNVRRNKKKKKKGTPTTNNACLLPSWHSFSLLTSPLCVYHSAALESLLAVNSTSPSRPKHTCVTGREPCVNCKGLISSFFFSIFFFSVFFFFCFSIETISLSRNRGRCLVVGVPRESDCTTSSLCRNSANRISTLSDRPARSKDVIALAKDLNVVVDDFSRGRQLAARRVVLHDEINVGKVLRHGTRGRDGEVGTARHSQRHQIAVSLKRERGENFVARLNCSLGRVPVLRTHPVVLFVKHAIGVAGVALVPSGHNGLFFFFFFFFVLVSKHFSLFAGHLTCIKSKLSAGSTPNHHDVKAPLEVGTGGTTVVACTNVAE